MKDDALREQIASIGKSLYERRLAHGSAGNISLKLTDGEASGSSIFRNKPPLALYI
jgi:ribulose-5-phosphate 4-epimerase/fuculose-1-phosphate aldolase